jgi:hypothetical protein
MISMLSLESEFKNIPKIKTIWSLIVKKGQERFYLCPGRAFLSEHYTATGSATTDAREPSQRKERRLSSPEPSHRRSPSANTPCLCGVAVVISLGPPDTFIVSMLINLGPVVLTDALPPPAKVFGLVEH